MHCRDNSETLRSTLSEKNGCPNFDVLRSVHEVEFDKALVTGTEELIVHLEDSGSLANDTAVDHSLIVLLDCGGVMQDNDFCVKVLSALRARLFIKENHTLPEVCTFHLKLLDIEGLDTKADCLTRDSNVDLSTFVMNRLHNNWVELTILVWSQKQLSVGQDSARLERAGHDDTNTSDVIDTINQELNWVRSRLKVSTDPYSRLKHGQKFFELW